MQYFSNMVNCICPDQLNIFLVVGAKLALVQTFLQTEQAHFSQPSLNSISLKSNYINAVFLIYGELYLSSSAECISHSGWKVGACPSSSQNRTRIILLSQYQPWFWANQAYHCLIGCFAKTFFRWEKLAQPALQVFGGCFEGIQKDFWFWQVLRGAQVISVLTCFTL